MQLQVVHLVIAHGAGGVAHHLQRDGLARDVPHEAADREARVIAHLAYGETVGLGLGHLQDGLHGIHVAGDRGGGDIDAIGLNLHGVALFTEELVASGVAEREVEGTGLGGTLGGRKRLARKVLVVRDELVDDGLEAGVAVGHGGQGVQVELASGVGEPLLDLGHDGGLGVALGGGSGPLHLIGDVVGDGLLAGPLLGDLPGNLNDLVGQRVMDGASLTDNLLEVGTVELNGKAGGNLRRLDLGDVGGNGLIAHTIELADDALERLVHGLYVGIGLELDNGHAVPLAL